MVGIRTPDTPESFPDGVTALTAVPHGTVMAMWERALFGVFPSKWPEPLATVVHEAMSNGRPAIGTTPGGHEDMIEDGETGFLVPGGDAEALAAAMARLIDDPDAARAPRRRGQATRQPLHPRSGRPSARALLLRHDRGLAGEVVVRRLSAPWWGDLTAVVGLTLVAFVVALAPVPGPARTVALLPLLLVLPGYALTCAMFLPGEIGRDLRLVLSVAFSVGVAAVGGLVVQLVIRLDRPVWVTLLALVTVVAALAALRRRDGMPADTERPTLENPDRRRDLGGGDACRGRDRRLGDRDRDRGRAPPGERGALLLALAGPGGTRAAPHSR